MQKVKEGNLNLELTVGKNDEIGYLADSFNDMIAHIKELILSIRNASVVASSSSQSLSSTCQQSYAFTEEMFSMANVVQELMDKLVIEVKCERKNIDVIEQIADNAKAKINSIDKIAIDFRELSDKNNNSVTSLSIMSENIKNAMVKTSTTIKELAKASSQIVKITEDICEMSSETKLLALNAAIESSKINSKSFTNANSFNVVSQEIHKLSDKFRLSASNINSIIKNIVEKINESEKSAKELESIMRETDVSIMNVKSNIEINNDCIDKTVALNGSLHGSVEEIHKLTSDIVASIKLIDTSSHEVLQNINNIVKAHNEQVEMSKFLVSESESLYSLSEELTSTTKAFNV